jgi:predicted DNA-binding ArsR family transcriptional regulator
MNVPRTSLNFNEAASEATVKLKLPWHVVLGALSSLAIVLIVLWASVGRLTEQVGELKSAVQAGNLIMVALQNDVNLLKYRVDATDKKLERIAPKGGQ